MSKKQPKVTPWFPADVKPVHVGGYQQMCGFGKELGYQLWDGASWFGWAPTTEGAMREKYPAAQLDKWRGLASDPKAAA